MASNKDIAGLGKYGKGLQEGIGHLGGAKKKKKKPQGNVTPRVYPPPDKTTGVENLTLKQFRMRQGRALFGDFILNGPEKAGTPKAKATKRMSAKKSPKRRAK